MFQGTCKHAVPCTVMETSDFGQQIPANPDTDSVPHPQRTGADQCRADALLRLAGAIQQSRKADHERASAAKFSDTINRRRHLAAPGIVSPDAKQSCLGLENR